MARFSSGSNKSIISVTFRKNVGVVTFSISFTAL